MVCERWHEVSVSNNYSLSHTCVCCDSFKIIFPHSCFAGTVTPELLLTGFLQCWPGFNPREIHVTFVVKEIVLTDNFSPGTLVFCDQNSVSGASTSTVRIILRNTCSCVQHLVPLVSPFLNPSIKLCLHWISTRSLPFLCFLWLSSVPPGKCQESTFIRPWPVPNPLQFMNHWALYSEPLTAP